LASQRELSLARSVPTALLQALLLLASPHCSRHLASNRLRLTGPR